MNIDLEFPNDTAEINGRLKNINNEIKDVKNVMDNIIKPAWLDPQDPKGTAFKEGLDQAYKDLYNATASYRTQVKNEFNQIKAALANVNSGE